MIDLTCSLCGGPHPFDTIIDNDTWNRVIRQGGPEGGREFLCLWCIIAAFAKAREGFKATLCGESLPVTSIEVRFSDD